MYSINSPWRNAFLQRYEAVLARELDVIIQQRQQWIGQAPAQGAGGDSPGTAETQGSRTRSCYDHSDCSPDQGYVCAQPESIDLPLSSTWGRFQCMYVANVAVAIKLATSFRSCNTGRCILEVAGTVYLDQAINVSYAHENVSLNKTNLSERERRLTPANISATGNTTSTSVTVSSSIPSLLNRLNSTNGLNATRNDTLASPSLLCPCNCTFFSYSCCFSSIVYEVRSGDNTTYDPPASGLKCMEETGKWENTSTATYNASAAAPIPSETVGIILVGSEIPIQSSTPNTQHPVCSSIGNLCTSWWSCGDGDHCECTILSTNQFFYQCLPKAGFGPNDNNRRKRHLDGRFAKGESVQLVPKAAHDWMALAPSWEERICPCNCTYTSHACCGERSGIVQEASWYNQGPVRLPEDRCCDSKTNQLKERGECAT